MADKKKYDDGGYAHPFQWLDRDSMGEMAVRETFPGMTLLDWFAGTMSEDDRLVKCVRAMDDKALEVFALHPSLEREEHITEVDYIDWSALPSEVAKVAKRLELEANAIACVRYMQAEAMIDEKRRREAE